MNFAQPLMLWGALAALVPLLIHLFSRRRPKTHPFGAISFVLRSQRRTASRLKLKRLLLFLLRTLLLLAVPVALARPQLRRDAEKAATARGPAATAIILDASLSMRFSADGQRLFERGREEARAAVRDLLGEEPANFVLCTAAPAVPPSPHFDRGRLRRAIDDAQPGFGVADMSRCMELAHRSLEQSPLPAKRLVVISDLTANAFHLEVPPPQGRGPRGEPVRPEVVLRDAARGERELPNRAVVDLKIEPALGAGPRAFQFTFGVKNHSSQAMKDVEVQLKVGPRMVAKGFVDLPPHGAAQKSFTHVFERGGFYVGEVSLAPDALPEDDKRIFAVAVPQELKALVIDGSPHAVRHRDEAFFVSAALAASGSPVQETLRDLEAGFREELTGYDLVLLLNVPAPSPADAARLESFVQKGGGLFISMGDQVDAEAYNQALGALLPRPLRLVKTAAARDSTDEQSRAARLSHIAFDHPLFSLFSGRAREGLVSSRFYRYMLVESEAGGGRAGGARESEVLAAYDDGAPALLFARRGAGRVLLYTSTVDRDWSDFAIRTSFLPLMQRFCSYLAGALQERSEARAQVGQLLPLAPTEKQISAVRAPSGEEVPLLRQPDGSVTAGPLPEPGLYQVLDSAHQPVPELAFAAALDPSESDLTRLAQEDLAAYFGEETVKASGAAGATPQVPLWTWLLVAACGAFFFEGVLLRK